MTLTKEREMIDTKDLPPADERVIHSHSQASRGGTCEACIPRGMFEGNPLYKCGPNVILLGRGIFPSSMPINAALFVLPDDAPLKRAAKFLAQNPDVNPQKPVQQLPPQQLKGGLGSVPNNQSPVVRSRVTLTPAEELLNTAPKPETPVARMPAPKAEPVVPAPKMPEPVVPAPEVPVILEAAVPVELAQLEPAPAPQELALMVQISLRPKTILIWEIQAEHNVLVAMSYWSKDQVLLTDEFGKKNYEGDAELLKKALKSYLTNLNKQFTL